jgi:hypothetical protein
MCTVKALVTYLPVYESSTRDCSQKIQPYHCTDSRVINCLGIQFFVFTRLRIDIAALYSVRFLLAVPLSKKSDGNRQATANDHL